MALAVLAMLAVCACSPESRQFQQPKILTDQQGQQYVVEHHVGDTFTVKRISISKP